MIDILLATYNGERFLSRQLDSLLCQSFQDFRVLIHDDGSKDDTVSIIKRYQSENPGKIIHIDDGVRLGGAKKNFVHLMGISDAPYIMFCDQDDVWFENKVELTFDRLRELEASNPKKAIIVHTDLRVVDEDLNVISDSLFVYQRLPVQVGGLDEMLVQNNITGCTMMINRQALDISLPVNDDAIMHDWWIGCRVLHGDGVISFLPNALIDYRQHSLNAIGSKKITAKYYLLKILDLKSLGWSYFNIWRQARAVGVDISFSTILFSKSRCIIKRVLGVN